MLSRAFIILILMSMFGCVSDKSNTITQIAAGNPELGSMRHINDSSPGDKIDREKLLALRIAEVDRNSSTPNYSEHGTGSATNVLGAQLLGRTIQVSGNFDWSYDIKAEKLEVTILLPRRLADAIRRGQIDQTVGKYFTDPNCEAVRTEYQVENLDMTIKNSGGSALTISGVKSGIGPVTLAAGKSWTFHLSKGRLSNYEKALHTGDPAYADIVAASQMSLEQLKKWQEQWRSDGTLIGQVRFEQDSFNYKHGAGGPPLGFARVNFDPAFDTTPLVYVALGFVDRTPTSEVFIAEVKPDHMIIGCISAKADCRIDARYLVFPASSAMVMQNFPTGDQNPARTDPSGEARFRAMRVPGPATKPG